MSEKPERSSVRKYNMAVPEMPEAFRTDFIKHARGISDAKDKRSKIDALALLMQDLNAYTKFHKITDKVNRARTIKADDRGLFTTGSILISIHGEKLVRDRIPKLYPENKYRKASRQELPRFFDLKIIEETLELLKTTPIKRLEEVADLTEAIYANMNFNNIIPAEVTNIVQSIEDMTGFDQRKARRALASKKK